MRTKENRKSYPLESLQMESPSLRKEISKTKDSKFYYLEGIVWKYMYVNVLERDLKRLGEVTIDIKVSEGKLFEKDSFIISMIGIIRKRSSQ